MNARLFQEFRAMQMAVIGACASKGQKDVKALYIEGIDAIELGDNALITEICLDKDIVTINMFDNNSYAPINNFSDDIIEEIVDTMRAKALDIAGTDVMVNFNGEMDYSQIRY